MPKAGECKVCRHKKAGAINKAIVSGEMSLQKIAQTFRVPYPALYRHRKRHLPAELVKRRDQTLEDAAQSLVSELEQLTEKTALVLARALAKNDGDLALKAIARRERQIELKGRLLGTLEERDRSPQHVEVHYVDVDKAVIVAGKNAAPVRALPAAEAEEQSR